MQLLQSFNISKTFYNLDDVAVIDEIQLLKEPQRGWAWTRAFLGIIAKEVHVCGERGAATLLQRLCETTGETVEVTKSESSIVICL